MQLPKYNSYKDSGVKWLGEIPEEWDVERNLGIFDERKIVNHPDKELLSVTIEKGVIKQSEITTKKDSSNEDKSKYKLLKPGYLAYNKMRMWQGAVGMSEYEGIVSPAYIILSPRDKAYSRFFHYLLRSDQFLIESNRLSYGLCDDMNSLRYEDFKGIYTPLPPKKTVERIISFLDQKTAEIDEAIAKKQKLIELLQEQKSILINQAVTKGLNPDAPMKDSGVEWIGEIPAHWLTPPMYARFRIELGKMLDSKRITGKRLLPYLRNTDVQWDGVNVEDLPEMDFAANEIERFTVKPGDLLVCEGGEIGRSAICNESFADMTIGYQKALHRIRPFDDSESIEYLNYTFICACECSAFSRTAKANTISHLTGEMLSSYRFPKPPIYEQQEISSYLNSICEDHKIVIKKHEDSISKLTEYKQSLISSAATGKIKV